MPPEILDRKKYKKPTDIYSFAITIQECFTWDIAECVTSGKRSKSIHSVENDVVKEVIELSWKQEPKDRLTIGEIVEKLEIIGNCSK